MANEQVVDELVVRLSLDASQYDKADKEKNKRVDATEKKERATDQQRQRRQRERNKDEVVEKRQEGDRQKRLGQTERAVKSLGSTLKTFALTTAAVFGIGAGVGGIVNAITNLTGFETSLRRQAVSTGLSNREMQAWGATAKRLGADADAGAAAIAGLAREQKQFNITGQGPTMQALARLGVNVTPGAKPEDLLEQAQQIYRRSNPAQQQQMEAQLSAQGVSDDLIVMIKSETDAREAYTRSVADSVEENKASMAALNDAFTSVKQAALQLGNVLAVSATPYIKEFGDWVHNLASDPHKVDDWLAKTGSALSTLRDIAVNLAHGMKDAWTVVNAIAHPIAQASNNAQSWLHKGAKEFQAEDPNNDYRGTPPGLFLRRALHSIGIGNNPDLNLDDKADNNLDQDWSKAFGDTPSASSGTGGTAAPVSAQDLAQMLTQRGMTPAQAMAATANALREAPGAVPGTIDPSALNPNGGASGAFQWIGDRKAEFQRIFGMAPNEAPLDTQLDFLFGNATEVARTQQAFAGGGSAQQLGQRFSQIFEAHGNVAEDIKRGQLAAQLAGNPIAPSAGTPGAGTGTGDTNINLNGPITVQADNPSDFIGGIQRIAQVQNYNGAVR